ncbi:YTH domain-containing protein [Tanacetum coccineum]
MKVSPSPKKRKMTVEPQNITGASVQVRFCRALMELQITGLLRIPSKKRLDFVKRVAFIAAAARYLSSFRIFFQSVLMEPCGPFMGIDGQKPYFSSLEAMLGYSWNSKSATGSNGIKSNDYKYKRTMNPYAAKSSSYGDMKSRQQSAYTVPTSFLQPILRSLQIWGYMGSWSTAVYGKLRLGFRLRTIKRSGSPPARSRAC